MIEEIKQNGMIILSSVDGHSIPVIFKLLQGKGMSNKEYESYLKYVAFDNASFTYGKIEYYIDGRLESTGVISEV